jgi:hypothetical protein
LSHNDVVAQHPADGTGNGTLMTGIANDEKRRKAGMKKNRGASLTLWFEEEMSVMMNRNRNVEQNIGLRYLFSFWGKHMNDFTEDQIKAALIQNNGWNGGGALIIPVKKSSQAIKLLLIILILGLFFCREISANNEPVPVFELKYTSRGQPNYIIKIYRDGKVHYHGDKVMAHGVLTQQVGVIGDRYAQMTQAQLNELIIYFLSLPFELSKKYEMKRPSLPVSNIINYKEFYMSIYMNDPVFYDFLTKKLDELIDIRQWVCFPDDYPKYPKDHPKYKTCLLRDDIPDTIESLFK